MEPNHSELAHVQDLILALDKAVSKLEKQFGELMPALQTELQAFLSGRVYQLSAENRNLSKEEITAQCVAIRQEAQALIERGMAAILMKRQEVVSLAEIEHTLKRFASEAATGVLRQFATEHETKISTVVRHELAAQPPMQSTPGDPTAAMTPMTTDFASLWRGQWTKSLQLKRNNLVSFRGSVYLVLRDIVGVLPTKQNQQGPNAAYALFAPAGSPGPQGIPGASILGTIVAFPAAANSTGTAGQVSWQDGYMAYCRASDTWVFWPTTSTYPF